MGVSLAIFDADIDFIFLLFFCSIAEITVQPMGAHTPATEGVVNTKSCIFVRHFHFNECGEGYSGYYQWNEVVTEEIIEIELGQGCNTTTAICK